MRCAANCSVRFCVALSSFVASLPAKVLFPRTVRCVGRALLSERRVVPIQFGLPSVQRYEEERQWCMAFDVVETTYRGRVVSEYLIVFRL